MVRGFGFGLLVAGCVVVGAGCSDDGGSSDTDTACDAFETTNQVIEADYTCVQENGDLLRFGALTYDDCDDGRSLYVSHYGFGFVDDVWIDTTFNGEPADNPRIVAWLPAWNGCYGYTDDYDEFYDE